ncbi:hypothetical protein [uncultured Chryseobacterium sp.]|uniref:GH39 family glycosyl hydrolase n=1 Tax=uncultured Chryseobacterium sp. TaxID=259322 RepID=UPI0025D11BC9|nr:hypothetical protein [uncultured Chryseobacterium sp.]
MKELLKNLNILLMITSVFICNNAKSQRIKDSVNVDINFGNNVKNVKSMSGFLHFDDVKKLEKSIVALQPKYWRIGWSYKSVHDVEYLRRFGITPILVISDRYGYPGKKNNKEWPHPLTTDRLTTVITAEYHKFRNNVIYDIWNEPFHQGGFGDFDKDEYYKIFKKAHDIIRSLPGGQNALITGPSFDRYDEREMEDFLKFCNANKIRVDILAWHEWRDGIYEEAFSKDVKKLRNIILPKYPKVGVKKIVLNEIINQYSQFSPSEVLQVFKMLEDNNIDGACKGCWAESDGVFNCNNSINGLLDTNGKTRSVWWAYKIYNQSTKNRVFHTANYDKLSVFASFDDKGEYIILNNNSGNKIVNSKVTLNKLYSLYGKMSNVDCRIYEISDSGELPLENLVIKQTQKLAVNKNASVINIPEMKPKTVYYLSISK